MATSLENTVYTLNVTPVYEITANESINSTIPEITTKSPYGKYGELEKYTTFWIAFYVNRLYLRILTPIGVPGNAAAFITIMFLKPISSSSLYIAFLAIVDTLALIFFILYDELARSEMELSHHGCRFLYFTMTATIMISNWTLVCTTVERFIAIWFPFKVNTICTKKNAIRVICAIVVFFILLNLHFLFVIEENFTKSGRPLCGFAEEYTYFETRVWYYIDFVFFALVPCVILFVCNGLIIFGMIKSQEMQKEMNQKEEQLREKEKQQRQIAIMLVTISVVFILLTLPNGIWYIYKNYWIISSVKERAAYLCADKIIRCLSTVNHAINFYFYFITGRKFRNKFMEIIFCRSPKKSSMYASTSMAGVSQSRSTNVSTIPMSTVNPKS